MPAIILLLKASFSLSHTHRVMTCQIVMLHLSRKNLNKIKGMALGKKKEYFFAIHIAIVKEIKAK